MRLLHGCSLVYLMTWLTAFWAKTVLITSSPSATCSSTLRTVPPFSGTKTCTFTFWSCRALKSRFGAGTTGMPAQTWGRSSCEQWPWVIITYPWIWCGITTGWPASTTTTTAGDRKPWQVYFSLPQPRWRYTPAFPHWRQVLLSGLSWFTHCPGYRNPIRQNF